MRYVATALLLLATQTLSAPSSRKPITLFTCPSEGLCYASPRNCIDNCNAAFSIVSTTNNSTTYNMTMMSPLKYTAVLIKEQGSLKYDKAIICSFHATRGIVARVNYPNPIVIHQFVDATDPDGVTDSDHTQCSTTISMAPPNKARFKMFSGKWESELVIDEDLAIDVVPAVEDARILSNAEKIDIPSAKMPAVRSSSAEDEAAVDEKISEKRQFEKKRRGGSVVEDEEEDEEKESKKRGRKKGARGQDKNDRKEEEMEKEETSRDSDDSNEAPPKKTKSRKVPSKDTERRKKGRKTDEDQMNLEEIEAWQRANGKTNVPRWSEYNDMEEDEKENKNELDNDTFSDDPDHASAACLVTSLVLSLYSIYCL